MSGFIQRLPGNHCYVLSRAITEVQGDNVTNGEAICSYTKVDI
jgi:hypothetical protein